MEKNKKRFLISVYFQDIFAIPLAKFLIRIRVHPNFVTLTGLLSSLASSYFYYKSEPLIGALLFTSCLILDSTDGRVARGLGKQSKMGAILDSISDKSRSFLVSLAIIINLGLGFASSILIYFYIQALPVYRALIYDYSADERDPIQIFWEGTFLKSWLDRKSLVGIYNGWERAVVVCVIAPLTNFTLELIIFAVLLEQILFLAGLVKTNEKR